MQRDTAPRMLFRIQGLGGAGKSEIALGCLAPGVNSLEDKVIVGGPGLAMTRK